MLKIDRKILLVTLSFIFFSIPSYGITRDEERDSFGRTAAHQYYKVPVSNQDAEWALVHRIEKMEYEYATGLRFYDLSRSEREAFVELSDDQKREFYATKRQEAKR
ncbi:MAG: hypothetical protein K2P93_04175 [Alphaproteobacteria bacterium]|nr:hypothetical protein [Alphaproteobacteria bacterium]